MGEGEEIVKMKAVDMTLQYYQQNSGEFVTGTVLTRCQLQDDLESTGVAQYGMNTTRKERC